jgi:predicted small secreted protein
MKRIIMPTILLATAALTLAACQKKPADVQADAVRNDTQATATAVDNSADTIEANGKADASMTKNATENQADALRNQADAIEKNGENRADAIEAGKVPPAPVTPKP